MLRPPHQFCLVKWPVVHKIARALARAQRLCLCAFCPQQLQLGRGPCFSPTYRMQNWVAVAVTVCFFGPVWQWLFMIAFDFLSCKGSVWWRDKTLWWRINIHEHTSDTKSLLTKNYSKLANFGNNMNFMRNSLKNVFLSWRFSEFKIDQQFRTKNLLRELFSQSFHVRQ